MLRLTLYAASRFCVIFFFGLVASTGLSAELQAQAELTKGGSKEQRRSAESENAARAALWRQSPQSQRQSVQSRGSIRPYADYEEAGYVFMSDEFRFDSRHIKEAIVRETPPEVTVVIFANDSSPQTKNRILKAFGSLRDPSTLKIISLPDARRGFWARDGLPVPVIRTDLSTLGVVDARYYHGFEPDQEIAKSFSAPLTSHSFFFEGGNFMSNPQGDCIIINNSRHAQIPDAVFEDHYGCTRLVRLPHLLGIGHIDERVRFLNDSTVVTDLPAQYRSELEGIGLTVLEVPRPSHGMYTYVNSLIINGVVFVPVFGESTDQAAVKVYEDAGYAVQAVSTNRLSADGQGSIHCITMTYPHQPFAALIKTLGAKQL